jgi:hypothetical protein
LLALAAASIRLPNQANACRVHCLHSIGTHRTLTTSERMWLLQPERRKRHCRLTGKAGKVCHCGRPHHRQSKQYRQYDLPYFEKTGLLSDCREFRCYSIAEPWDDSEDQSASKPARGRSVVAGATRQTGKLPARSHLWPQSCARDPCINIQTARLSQNLRIYPIEQFQLPAYPCPRERSYPTER